MNRFFKIFFVIFGIILLAGLTAFGFFSYRFYKSDFFKADLVDIINIGLTIIVSGILVVLIFTFTERNESRRQKSEIYHELLSRLQVNFENKLIFDDKVDLKEFWFKTLIIKKDCECILPLLKETKVKKLQLLLNELEIKIKEYFELVEVEFFPNATINNINIKNESNAKTNVCNKLIECIFVLY